VLADTAVARRLYISGMSKNPPENGDDGKSTGAKDATGHDPAVIAAEVERLLQRSSRQQARTVLGGGPWVTVHRGGENRSDSDVIFSELIPRSMEASVVADSTWDAPALDPEQLAGYLEMRDSRGTHRSFGRYGNSEGREPLVVTRLFRHDLRIGALEINESFRLFFNLWYDDARRVYVRFDVDGRPHDVVRMHEHHVEVDRAALAHYLGAREMSLVLKFSMMRFSDMSLAELGLEGSPLVVEETVRDSDLAFDWFCESSHGIGRTFSHFRGNHLVRGLPTIEDPAKFGVGPKQFVSFVIGRDQQGAEILFACDPDTLADYFGKNRGAPHFLTPVFFRRDVLQKYYNQPERFEIGDGYVSAQGLWHLDIDNHHDRYVIAFLGDLGRSLTPSEQGYWRSFNVPPDGDMSEVAQARAFRGEFVDATKPDLVFRSRLVAANDAWKAKFGWPLFLSLGPGDAHLLDTLRIPIVDSANEFDSLVLALAKMMVDSLNEAEICTTHVPAKALQGGITRLTALVTAEGLQRLMPHLDLLRDVQALRSSGTAHRKGDSYRKLMARLGLDRVDRIEGFTVILNRAVAALDAFAAA